MGDELLAGGELWGESGFHEAVAALPLVFEAVPDGGDFGGREGGVGLSGEAFGFGFGEFKEGAVAEEVGDAELGEAGLARAEELAGAALLEVELGEFEAVLRGDHGIEADVGLFGDLVAGHQNAVAFGGSAADASAELVELREAEAFGVIDDHDAGVGDVDADLDDGGRDEDVDVAALEAGHGDFLVVGAESAVEEAEAQAGEGAGAELVVHLGGGTEFGFFGEEFFGVGALGGFGGGGARAYSPRVGFGAQPGAAPQARVERAFSARVSVSA